MSAPQLAPLLQASDVAELLGESFVGPEVAQVDTLIRFASALARARVSTLDERVNNGSLPPDLVVGVLASVVARAFDTLRTGLRVRSQQFPEVTTTYADSLSSLVYLTADEVASLAPPGGATGDAFTITPFGVPG